MNPEQNEDSNLSQETEQNSDKFGKVIDVLHSKQKLPSLRTYQGDMAEFIKEKNESVMTVTLKEKKRKEEKEEEKKKEEKLEEDLKTVETGAKQSALPQKTKSKNFKTNILVVFFSLLLLAGGVVASIYIFKLLETEPISEIVIKTAIIPYNSSAKLSNVTKENLRSELAGLPLSNGINVVEISNVGGLPIQIAKDFFGLLGVSLPNALTRTLRSDYVVGVISKDAVNQPFLIITVDDFGRAFSAMLDWEKSMAGDLAFLNFVVQIPLVPKVDIINNASSTATTTLAASSTKSVTNTTEKVQISSIEGPFTWKDIIIKNKDTRGLVNKYNQVKIAYTFLDKNTILIVSDIGMIGEISSAFVSRSVAR
jgi:hypothetical protein